MKFVGSKPVTAIKDGFMLTMPLTIIGSLFLLLAFIPITGYGEFMSGIFGAEWQAPLFQVVGATFDLLALVGVFGIAYCYVTQDGIPGVSAGILGIVSLVIVMNSFVIGPDGSKIGGVIPKTFLGGKGMIAAIIIGLIVGKIYSFIILKNWTIKLPDSVPAGVSNAFTSLIPGFAIVVFSFLVFIFFKAGLNTTIIDFIYSVIQAPIQGLSDSLVGVILIPVLISLLWWFGIHGSGIVMGIMGPILQANALQNQELVIKGVKLIAGQPGVKLVTNQFVDQFITVGGAGLTLGLVVTMIIFGKSTQYKDLGKLSIIPGLFNINEPILFGTPVVFNPYLFIPFVAAPLASSLLVYLCLNLHIIDPFTAISVPWTTPIVLSGFIIGGFKTAILQVVIFFMTVGIYFPFFKYQDKLTYEAELKYEAENK